MKKDFSRRSFITRSAALAGGIMIVPRHVLGGPGYRSPSDQLNIAAIGAGGRGQGVLQGASGFNEDDGTTLDNVVALADVDDERAAGSFERYSRASRYRDFRVMLDEMHDSIDAVAISTPDHMHAVAAMAAMQLGKHVYVEKPLTHDVYEARKLTEAAREYGVVTQMGNQGSSGEGIRQICEWIWAGAIGDVTEVHTWTNRPVWPQGKIRPEGTPPVPASLDWDLWLGTAPDRPYHPEYLPFSWRGWWDFGTGALGDMACHVVDPVYKALKLGYPTSVEASATVMTENWQPIPNHESAPLSSIIHFEFPAREGMPPVKMSWYDGGLMPPMPDELAEGESLSPGGGCIFIGSKGKIMCATYGANPTLLPSSKMADFEEPEKTLPRVEGGTGGHQRVWVEACKGGPACSSNFDYAGPFTETVLLGNLALRSFMHTEMREMPNGRSRPVFTGRKKLMWDGDQMKITNYDPANAFVKRDYRGSWSL